MSHISGKSALELASRLIGTLRTLGVVDTAWLATRRRPEAALMARDARRDRALGVETTSPLEVERQRFLGDHADHAIRYYPTNPRVLRSIFRALDIRYPDWTFIDVGCGKGRVLITAAEHPFARIIGVESSLTTARIARENMRRIGRPDIEVNNCDVLDFELPRANLILYLYNPFVESSHVYGRLLGRVEQMLERSSRKVFVAYSCPVSRAVFDACPFLRTAHERRTLVGDYDWVLYETRSN